ncbi:hypothetical protein AB5N19_04732 [Seiridium cardinale]
MASVNNYEPVVLCSTRMPKGYVFVAKGDRYITGNCRKQTQAAGQTVYAVVDKNNHAIGIRVPYAVHSDVLASEALTRQDRAAVVQKRDDALKCNFRETVQKLFPKAPVEDIPKIVTRAMEKGSGRVGRTSKIDIEGKAKLAVKAHIRHCHTDYDKLLKQRVSRETARQLTLSKTRETVMAWGGSADQKKARKKVKKSRPSSKSEQGRVQSAKKLLRKAEKQAEERQSGRSLKTGPNLSNGLPSPKKRRRNELKDHRNRSISAVASTVNLTGNSMGRSLKNYDVESSGSEWSGSEYEDSD